MEKSSKNSSSFNSLFCRLNLLYLSQVSNFQLAMLTQAESHKFSSAVSGLDLPG